MGIDELIGTYLTACAVEGKSANTIFSYRASLADFRRVGNRLGFPDSPDGYTVREVYAFLEEVQRREAKPAYQYRRHREVKAFFSWCRRMGYVEENAFARVPLVKLEQQIVQPFKEQEVQRLLSSQDTARYTGCRNYAVFLFLLDTGVRASECVSVLLEDVDWERPGSGCCTGRGRSSAGWE
ncbi:MAG: tyrosine-type recombinase/integrase [Dehalococcoidia bacterium]|nr:tyrosine-type recombinase/integrase [Dehalococcoidia bacterium]